MIAAASVPIAAALLGQWDLVPVCGAMALLILWRHKENIGRLVRGEEPRIGASAPADPDE